MRLTPVLLFVAATLSATSMAQEQTVTWYDVEIIVFRHLDARTSETWPPDAGAPEVEALRALFPPQDDDDENDAADAPLALALDDKPARRADAPVPYVPLDASARQLNGIFGSLRRSSRYEPLVHVAWTQPPLDRNQSPQLRLTVPGALNAAPETAEDTLPEPDRPLLGRVTDEETAFATPDTGDVPEFLEESDARPQLARPLDGRVQMFVSRYLHLDLDLLYLPDNIDPALLGNNVIAGREWTEDERRQRERRRRDILDALARGAITIEEAEILSLEPERATFEGFRLNQFRRLRSREVHYFDHPVFGAIVTVTPRQVSARLLEAEPDRGTLQ